VYGGDPLKANAPDTNATFTGRVTAMAHGAGSVTDSNYTPEKFAFLDGSAALTIGAALSNTSLALDFADFYKVTYSGFTISGAGAFNDYTGLNVTPNFVGDTNKYGIKLDHANLDLSDDVTYLRGQFYGNPGDASEAVGAFSVYDTNESGIKGAFGVKKP
jgi:hypothetical protein